MKKETFMTKKEVQEYLKISPATLDRLMNDKAFPYIKLRKKGKVLFRKSDIDKFLEEKTIK